ncbi:MAG: metallophosphoesterase [Bacteroidia bacterium]|nr:metallophosphoesterase [Bacteroidia bacterium]
MTPKNYYLSFLFVIGTFTLMAQTTLINYGSSWSYFDNQAEPALQGSLDWNDITYDASSWSAGSAHLGYGDGDEVTTINPNTYTVYVRHSFNISDPGNFDSLNLNLTYDDGAIVYLNGVEVWRINMPAGSVNYNTFTPATSPDNAQASQVIANSLVAGTNVVAVEVHQRSSGSSDISFDFELEGYAPGQVNVSRGPYLQKGTPNSMVVRWRTVTPTETVIDYGTSLGNLSQNYTDLTLKTEHEVELTGLSPETVYYYQISNATTVLIAEAGDIYFKTHPNAGASQPYRFWVLGDAGTANSDQRAVRDAYYNYIGSDQTDGILFLGDNAYNSGTDSEYEAAVFDVYDQKLKNTIAWSTLGNHDGYSADSGSQTGPYYDIFTFPTNAESGGTASGTEAYYSFDYGNIHFIVLESYETNRSVGGAMYNWALNDIQNTTQDWIVAFWHHPPYTKGSHNSDTESQLIDMRQNFLPMLESNGVDLVLAGHSHSYERSYFLNGHYGLSGTFDSATHTVGTTGDGDGKTNGNGAYVKSPDGNDGAVYITAGSSGKISGGSLNHPAMYASLNTLGSCILEVDGSSMNLKFIDNNGAIADYFTIQKGCSTVGQSCDDGDSCTVNDVYDNDCNCAGTPEPDADGDGICDAEDICPGSDDTIDTDGDGTPDGCDDCPNSATGDSDGDGVCDDLDICPGSDDAIDTDGDGTPDGCDACPNSATGDSDGDGVCDDLDICAGSDDTIDTDGDGTPDGCDACPNSATGDSDGDGVCDDSDVCPGGDDTIDTDGDGIPDFCDTSSCIADSTSFDSSTLTVGGSQTDSASDNVLPSEAQDVSFTVSGMDHRISGKKGNRYIEEVTITYVDGSGNNQTYGVFGSDNNNVAVSIAGLVQSVTVSLTDGYDGNTNQILTVNLSQIDFCVETITCTDTDGDGVCDENDAEINSPCPGTVDANGVSIDTDGDGVCDDLDICPGSNDAVDTDNDSVPDGCDQCEGFDDSIDSDSDGIPDGCDNPVTCDPAAQGGTTLTHSGAGSNEVTYTINGQDVSFTISGLDQRTNGKPANRYVEQVSVSYTDGDNNTVNLGPYTGTNGGSVVVVLPGGLFVKTVTVGLSDGYDGNSSTQMSVNISDIDYCVENAAPAMPVAAKDSSLGDIKVYPNPVSKSLNINLSGFDTVDASVMLYNITGRIIVHQKLKGSYNQIDVANLSDGLYLLLVKDQSGIILSIKRIVIKH